MKNTFFLLSVFLAASMLLQAQWSDDAMINNAISSAAGEQAIPKVATSEGGTTYISWFSNESGNYNVRLQKLDLFGYPAFEDDGMLVSNHPAMTWLTDWDMAVDQEDHAILTFQDIRNGDNDVFAYRISPNGDFLWGMDGIEMSTGPAFDAAPKVCVTNSGNAVFAWQAEEVVILQKISPDGIKLWGDNGITLSGSNTYSWPQLLAVGEDDVILKYFEDSGPVWAPTRHVFAQRYDADGNTVWENPAVVSNAGGISAWTQVFSMINDGDDGFFIAWHDDRDSDMNSSVFVQHIGAEGLVLLGDDGTEASTLFGRQHFYPYLARIPGLDDIFVMWNEMDADQNNRGIYGQKISASGERLWTDHGKVFIEISPTNVYPFSAGSSGENLVLFFEKYSNVLDAGVSAMLIDGEGEFIWPGQFVELCGVQSEKVHSVAGTFVFDQWISAWEDDRNGNKDIYAQNIRIDGTLGALPSVAEIEIFPDTLFIEENGLVYSIYLINTSYVSYPVDSIYANSAYWELESLPEFPVSIEPNDTLELTIPVVYVGYGGAGSGYVYDTVFVENPWETNTSIVAFNLDVIPGITNMEEPQLRVYPNPGSTVVFETRDQLTGGVLQIYASSGQLIRHWTVTGNVCITWDGKNQSGNLLPAGNYVYRLVCNKGIREGKIILSR